MFVTSTRSPCEDDKRAVLGLATDWVHRRNVGYDFGSWCTGVALCQPNLSRYDQLLFVNDSVYCLTEDLSSILTRARKSSWDVWSATDSFQGGPHLQSYMWGLRRNELSSQFLTYFWERHYRFLSERDRVIRRYELRLASIAARFSLSVGALNGCSEMLELSRRSLHSRQRQLALELPLHKINPSQHLAICLLTTERLPLVKRELLLQDPFHTGFYSDVATWAKKQAPARWAEVEAHLEESRKGQA
jgi:hypothetical protein